MESFPATVTDLFSGAPIFSYSSIAGWCIFLSPEAKGCRRLVHHPIFLCIEVQPHKI
jgi:hypothetical protein